MSAAVKIPMTEEQSKERNRRTGRNNKKKGTRNEHKSMDRDSAAGAYVVRAGGSLGLFDYIALYPNFVRLVQVKSNRWPDHAEMTGLEDFEPPQYGRKFIERWDDYAKLPRVREVL